MRITSTPFSFLLAAGMLACPSAGVADTAGRAVSVEILADSGRRVPFYPAAWRWGQNRVYAEAFRGESYRIRVRNNLDRRVGLVIAVDGRNIISGGKSWLQNGERMYVLEPYASGEYGGWRTGQDRVNRFYFTDVPDSYASAFGDESAMGVIAVAVYPEVRREPPPPRRWNYHRDEEGRGAPSGAAPAAPEASAPRSEAYREKKSDSAGTGYGQEEYAPSYTVSFQPEASPREKVLIKYEWRDTLVRLGVIPRGTRRDANRLWDAGYAPPPPGRD